MARLQEKWSYDNHNLACIIVFPPHQRHGYGNLMIEFSTWVTLTPYLPSNNLNVGYEVSRWEGYIGSPERPLSAMGLKSYLAYWTKAIINFLRFVSLAAYIRSS
jgi:histone acetyltransferase MYST1